MKVYIVNAEDRDEEYGCGPHAIYVCNSYSLAISKMESIAFKEFEKIKNNTGNEVFLENGTDSINVVERIPTGERQRAEWGEFLDDTKVLYWVTAWEVETE